MTEAVFLCLNGPSLSTVADTINEFDITVAAVNNGWCVVRPDVWCGVDSVDRFHVNGWRDESIIKFVPSHRLDRDIVERCDRGWWRPAGFVAVDAPRVRPFKLTSRFNVDSFLTSDDVQFGTRDRVEDAMGHKACRSVMIAMIRLLSIEIGAKRIYLVGCDFRIAGCKHYAFNDRAPDALLRGHHHYFSVLSERLAAIRPRLESIGVEILNATEGSGLDAFESIRLEDAIQRERAARRRGRRSPVPGDTLGWYSQKWPKIKRAREIVNRVPFDRAATIYEIGVLRGRLSQSILDHLPYARLHMVDPWKSAVDGTPWHGTGTGPARMSQDEMNDAMREAVDRVDRHGNRAIIERCCSADAATRAQDNTIDLVFLDGDHSYDGVKRDIRAWWPKVKDGGFIGGHDYKRRHRKYQGNCRAVDERFGHRIEFARDGCWFVRKAPLDPSHWPVFVTAYTPAYKKFADRLRRSAERFDLPFQSYAVEDRGSWGKNLSHKAEAIRQAMRDNGCAVCWVDADAEFVDRPDRLSGPHWCDAAACPSRRRGDVTSGTLLVNNTPGGRRLIERMQAYHDEGIEKSNDTLTMAVKAMRGLLRFHHLPRAYKASRMREGTVIRHDDIGGMMHRKLRFRGRVCSGIGRHSEMVLPSRADHHQWSPEMHAGSLNVKVRGDVTWLDMIEPDLSIAADRISRNSLGTDAQFWLVDVRSPRRQVRCWIMRRIGSGLRSTIELVSERNLRRALNVSDGDTVKITAASSNQSWQSP